MTKKSSVVRNLEYQALVEINQSVLSGVITLLDRKCSILSIVILDLWNKKVTIFDRNHTVKYTSNHLIIQANPTFFSTTIHSLIR